MATTFPDAAEAAREAVLDAQIEFIQQILCPAPLRPPLAGAVLNARIDGH